MIKKTIVVLGLLATFITTVSGISFAARGPSLSPQTTCNLNKEGLDKLKSIQDNTDLDYTQRTKAELEARKTLLEETVDCSIEEALAIKDNLTKMNVDDVEAKMLQSQFASRLDDAANYYELQKSKIGDLGLQGSRNFAKDFKDWRDGNYKPSAKLAANFIIWAQNQQLLQSAENRINQLENTVNILKLVYNDVIQNLWRDANLNFNEAREDNQKAKLSLRASSPDEALGSIKSSLTALAKTYNNLSDLFTEINQSLKPE